jgi:7-cyano-7-deazaguanine synthase
MDRAAGGHVELVRPLSALDKRQAMQLGRGAPLELTFSCLAPRDGMHCGACNKCGERHRAFHDAGMTDLTNYAEAIRLAV